jgi:hypothetical protein
LFDPARDPPDADADALTRGTRRGVCLFASTAPAQQDTEGDEVVRSVFIDKAGVLEVLRARELYGRADWLDREMPALIDIIANASLLRTLGIDADAMLARDAAASR